MADLIFVDIGIIIIMATIAAFFAKRYSQPMIPAYIFAGLLIGPLFDWAFVSGFLNFLNLPEGFAIISDHILIQKLSEIGIAFLLFIVGLEINLKKLKDVEKVSGLGAGIQVLVIFLIGVFISRAMMFNNTEAIYIGLILAFSSTMVVVKTLSDRKELDTLHGRIMIGLLLVQDIIAILAMMVLGSYGKFVIWTLTASLFGGVALLLIAVFLSKFVFSKLFKYAADSRELFFLLSLSVCMIFSLFFMKIGFSIAIGAFVAGVALGNLPYGTEIIGRVKSLRDFFATMFFVSLGIQLPLGEIAGIILPLIVFVLIVLLIKPLVFLLIIGAMGYKKRTGFLTSISMAQVSEFALILVTQGMLIHQGFERIFALTIMLATITIALSSYFMKYEYKLYSWLSDDLSFFEKIDTHEDKLEYVPEDKHEVVLIGYDRTGYSIFHKLVKLKHRFLVIDYNPEIIKHLIRQKIPCIYGDAGNIEILDKLDFKDMKFIISTIPDDQTSLLVIKKAKRINPNVVIFVTSYHLEDALKLYDMGADYVILPHFLGGHHASILLEEATRNVSKLVKRKITHIKELNRRRELGHTHPREHHHYPKSH